MSVSNVPEITERVAVPRAVFVQHPFGRVLGDVGDRAGQRRVCDAALESLESADSPNHYRHLPYAWPESPEKVKWRPDVPAPLGSYVRQRKLDLAETIVRALRDEEREG